MCIVNLTRCRMCHRVVEAQLIHCGPISTLLAHPDPSPWEVREAFVWSPLPGCEGLTIEPVIRTVPNCGKDYWQPASNGSVAASTSTAVATPNGASSAGSTSRTERAQPNVRQRPTRITRVGHLSEEPDTYPSSPRQQIQPNIPQHATHNPVMAQRRAAYLASISAPSGGAVQVPPVGGSAAAAREAALAGRRARETYMAALMERSRRMWPPSPGR